MAQGASGALPLKSYGSESGAKAENAEVSDRVPATSAPLAFNTQKDDNLDGAVRTEGKVGKKRGRRG